MRTRLQLVALVLGTSLLATAAAAEPVIRRNAAGVIVETYHVVEGKREGAYARFRDDGSKEFEGTYLRDNLTGRATSYHANGKVRREATFVEGAKRGPWAEYFPSGQLASRGESGGDAYGRNDIDGPVPAGAWVYFHENGQKSFEGTYTRGLLNGKAVKYHGNGKIRREAQFINGTLKGLWTEYYASGQVASRGESDGNAYGQNDIDGPVPSGAWVYFHENGQKSFEGTYTRGMLFGKATKYHGNGKPFREAIFENGFMKGLWSEYYDDGQLRTQGMADGNLYGRNDIDGPKRVGEWSTFERKPIPAQPTRVAANTPAPRPNGARPNEATRANPPAPLNLRGTNLEQICQALSQRLIQAFTAEQRVARIQGELKTLVEHARPGQPGTQPAEKLRTDLSAFEQDWSRYATLRRAREQADRVVREQQTAAAAARAEAARVRAAAENQLVDPDTGKPSNRRNAVPAGQRRQVLARLIEQDRVTLNDPNLPREQARFQQERKARLQGVVDAIQAGMAAFAAAANEHVQMAETALAQARQRQAQAQRELAEARPGQFELSGRWRELKAVYDALRPAGSGSNLPALPADPSGLSPESLQAAVTTLAAHDRQVEEAAAANRRQLESKLQELRQADAELLNLQRSVLNLRATGTLMARDAVVGLGAKNDDTAVRSLESLHQTVNSGKEFFEDFDGRLDRLEQVRSALVRGKGGAEIIEKLKERLEIVNSTLGLLASGTEHAQQLAQLRRELDRPETALDGLATFLRLSKTLAEPVPVLGTVLSSFLDLYASAATASGDAARSILAHLVQADIANLPVAPEHHLYTTREIASHLSRASDTARTQAAAAVQIRRLAALLKARTAAEAANRPVRN